MLSAAEQLFLEQVNRARLDPLAEAARFGIALNEGLAPGTLDGSFSRQPLAANDFLTLAARGHSADYQTGGVVGGHTGSDGSSPADRAERAGYGSRFVGENLGFMAATNPGGTGPAFSAAQAMTVGHGLTNSRGHHEALFLSPGHRENMLFASYTEAGIGQDLRQQVNPGWAEGADVGPYPWTSSVVTSKFGREAVGERFLTGVIYGDSDNDAFYSIGEGLANIGITLGALGTTSAAAGGYGLKLAAGLTGLTAVSFSMNGQTLGAQVALGSGNVKLDLVGGVRLMASSDLVLGAGITEGGLLGLGNLSLTGNDLDNLLIAGRGNNIIHGGAGVDTVVFSGVMADYQITVTGGTVTVTDQRSDTRAQGTNTLTEVERLQFADQLHLLTPPPPPPPDPVPGDGPLTLSGHVHGAGLAGLAGAQVTFTPADGGALLVYSADQGSFTMHPHAQASGHLSASRAHGAGDPAITAADALDVLRLALGLPPSFGPAQAAHFVAADINADGRITATDALEVLRAAVGLASTHAPRWIFVDSALDLDGLGLDAANTQVPTGIAIAGMAGDLTDLSMTGILLGHMSG
jgi:hypothetical protein